ncbi:hypothetical protein [Streptomyces sp. NRRL S-241]|nr:hypothetical protein [Streptomyces sp. NRRL S-241]
MNFAVTYTHGSEGSWVTMFSANPDKLQMGKADDAAQVMGVAHFSRRAR